VAVAALGEARKAAPGNVAILFFLGVSEYNRDNYPAAETAFAKIAAEAPDTNYGARAREFLAAIEKNAPPETVAPASKRWDAYLQIGLQYDDNAGAAPDGVANTDTLRSFEYLRAGYKLIDEGNWRLRAEASGYYTQHWQNDFDRLDLQFVEGAVSLNRTLTLGEISVVPALRYGLTFAFLDNDEFKTGHRIWTSANIGWSDRFKTNVFYRVSVDDYENDGFLPVTTSRDGLTHQAGITQYFPFTLFERQSRFSLGYTYKNRQADGVNFDSSAHTVSAGLLLALPEKFTLNLSGNLAWDEYSRFPGVLGARETTIWGASIGVSRPLTDRLSATLTYSYTHEDSNYTVLDHDRSIVGLTLGYSF